jgi:hypothetical protein
MSSLSDERRIAHYQRIFMLQLAENRALPENPDGLFFYGFSDSQIDELASDIAVFLPRLARPFVIVDCRGKSLARIVGEAAGVTDGPVTIQKTWTALERRLQHETWTTVFVRFSQAKVTQRPMHARSIIKILDDAHFDGIRAASDIVFIDFASFLEEAWEDVSVYLRLVPRFDTFRAWLDEEPPPSLIQI